MVTHVGRRKYRLVMLPLIGLVVLGTIGLAPASAAQGTGPAPTVGEIVVDSYDCATGELRFHVTVTDLSPVPAGTTDRADYPLVYDFQSFYEGGPSFFLTQPDVYSPLRSDGPYSGNVSLSVTVPITNVEGAEPGTRAITSIDLRVSVGYSGDGSFDDDTDRSTLTYNVDCDGDNLADQLVTALKRILRDILGG